MRERLLLVKMIFAKVAWEGPASLTQEELAVLELSWERITAYSDPSWLKFKSREWIVLEDLFFHLRDRERWFFGTLNVQKHAQYLAGKGCLPSPCAYFGWVKSHKISSYLKVTNRSLWRKAPPKRFVGVGYRDSGQCRDPAWDASPSWQEIASQLRDHESSSHTWWIDKFPIHSRSAPGKIVFI